MFYQLPDFMPPSFLCPIKTCLACCCCLKYWFRVSNPGPARSIPPPGVSGEVVVVGTVVTWPPPPRSWAGLSLEGTAIWPENVNKVSYISIFHTIFHISLNIIIIMGKDQCKNKKTKIYGEKIQLDLAVFLKITQRRKSERHFRQFNNRPHF